MLTTTHYGLQEPEGNDTIDLVSVIKHNMDAIDAEMYANAQAVFGNTSVVISGGVATKDGTTATQLDVTAANVYFGTGQSFMFTASQAAQFTTATASTTYYLDYNSDGTVSWGTAHSAKAGYVTICTVATDASGNISTITDVRPMTVNAFGSSDTVNFGGQVQAQKFKGDGSQLTNLPIAPVNAATPTSLGTVEISDAPSNGNPVAVTTANQWWIYATTNYPSVPAAPTVQTIPYVTQVNGEPYFWNTSSKAWVPTRSYAG